eukprot:SAG31_NODE_1539_length_7970_cov_5.655571_7_plen_81_part_00
MVLARPNPSLSLLLLSRSLPHNYKTAKAGADSREDHPAHAHSTAVMQHLILWSPHTDFEYSNLRSIPVSIYIPPPGIEYR